MKKDSCTNCSIHKKPVEKCACSLCGQLYNNFSFKGGYICEDCLDSIKDKEESRGVYKADSGLT